jgi:HicB family
MCRQMSTNPSSNTSRFSLRLPRSLEQAALRLSKQDGTSMNQFVAMAVAEKVAAIDAVSFFETRRAKANLQAFDKLMARKRGAAPRAGDEV